MESRPRQQKPRKKTSAETVLRLEGIVASAMDGIITIDDQLRISMFNPAAERIFGLPAAAALNQHIGGFMPEHHRATHIAHIRRLAGAGATQFEACVTPVSQGDQDPAYRVNLRHDHT
ncbi:PAS domain-containing protein [Neorhizobium galegae]|uniref:PAS domain-containing protein n=1 Tax=Neorhizobium galegae bv. orientalis str. HAMBI 540 TaxID=1028800 RepID=A0A068SZL0_NEOGA|nr:PAS domain-containing protein [Neorhizobium galegae]MCQ1854526.1 PAS domain-containing protein [Neorhizobium galegae]CDN51642.1 Hypothetical protein RG540_PA09660 [Neorhizobium galegae bv. orientalis str. HAMBI 540]CDZ54779.1 Hypothetical protein NGAL_HAMBI2427_58130 [Neorhizobium galegae bv. orientalis]